MIADEQSAGHGGGGDDEVLEEEGEGEEDDDEGGAERGEAFEDVFVRRLWACFAHRGPPMPLLFCLIEGKWLGLPKSTRWSRN